MLKSFLFWGNGDWAQGNHLSCARKSSGASTDWARSRQKFFLDNISHRQFGTLSAKQRISYLHQAIFFAQMRFLTSFYPFPERHRRPLSGLPQSHLPCNAATPSMVVPPGGADLIHQRHGCSPLSSTISHCPLRLPPANFQCLLLDMLP